MLDSLSLLWQVAVRLFASESPLWTVLKFMTGVLSAWAWWRAHSNRQEIKRINHRQAEHLTAQQKLISEAIRRVGEEMLSEKQPPVRNGKNH